MKRIIFEANGHVPTIPASDINDYTRILLVNGSGHLGIIRFFSNDQGGNFVITFSEHNEKYDFKAKSWRELLDLVKDTLTIYYI